MSHFVKGALLSAVLLGVGGFGTSASAALITAADLFAPILPTGTTNTVVGVQGATPPSQATYAGNGYTISFAVPDDQGIVKGSIPSMNHAVPVAGVTPTGSPTYLTGDFGSTQTTDADAAGNFLSTGTGTITVTFSQPQLSLALLWGSIDAGNSLQFNNASGDTLTGAEVQALALGFTSNGYQGPGGSAYVIADSSTPFTQVTFTSNVTSFEFAAVVGSIGDISPVPLPGSAPLFGAALLALGAIGYGVKRKKATAAA